MPQPNSFHLEVLNFRPEPQTTYTEIAKTVAWSALGIIGVCFAAAMASKVGEAAGAKLTGTLGFDSDDEQRPTMLPAVPAGQTALLSGPDLALTSPGNYAGAGYPR